MLYKKLVQLGNGLHKCRWQWSFERSGYLEISTCGDGSMRVLWTASRHRVTKGVLMVINDKSELARGEYSRCSGSSIIRDEFVCAGYMRWLEYKVDKLLKG